MKSQQQNQGSSSQMDQDDMPPIKAETTKKTVDQADMVRQPANKNKTPQFETGQKSGWGADEENDLGDRSKNR